MSSSTPFIIQIWQKYRSGYEYLQALWIINRFEALLAYNIGYFLIVISLASDTALILARAKLFVVFAITVLLTKGIASIEDAIHDYSRDRNNPMKNYVASAVDKLGKRASILWLLLEFFISVVGWIYLSISLNSWVFVLSGTSGYVLGYIYSYPPRFKEKGIYNHILNAVGDVTFILLPGYFLVSDGFGVRNLVIIGLVFLNSFPYLIMHQAGDTFFDRLEGMKTFTQEFGARNSVLLSAIISLAISVSLICLGLLITAVANILFSYHLLGIFLETDPLDERQQSEIISKNYRIEIWATLINISYFAGMITFHAYF